MALTVEDQLKKVLDTKREVEELIKELHAAQQSAKDIVKRQRKQIDEEIQLYVELEVKKITKEIDYQMRSAAVEIIEEIKRDWREKLGLDA